MCVHAQSISHLWLFAMTWTVASLAPLSMELSKNIGMGYYSLLQGIFLPQGLNPHLQPSCIGRQILYPCCHLGSPIIISERWQINQEIQHEIKQRDLINVIKRSINVTLWCSQRASCHQWTFTLLPVCQHSAITQHLFCFLGSWDTLVTKTVDGAAANRGESSDALGL